MAISEFTRAVTDFLRWHRAQENTQDGLRLWEPGSRGEDLLIDRLNAEEAKLQNARDRVHAAGARLVQILFALGQDVAGVKQVLGSIGDGGGPCTRAEAIWPDVKARLEDLALRVPDVAPVVGAGFPMGGLAALLGDRTLDDAEADYRPAGAFPKGMRSRLRMASHPNRKSKRVRTIKREGITLYSWSDARRWWPHDLPDDTR